jgi:hypothetical protein
VATLPALWRLREAASHLTVVAAPRYRILFPAADAWVDADGLDAMRILGGTAAIEADLGVAWTTTAAEGLRGCGIAEVLAGSPRPPPGISIVDHLWAPLIPRFGARDHDPRVVPSAIALEAMRARLAGARPLVLSPGSGGSAKRPPLAWFHDLAARSEPPVLWIGGPVEAGEPGWGAPRWDDLDLDGLAALAALCRAWVAPDSGPAWLAAAAGARVAVVFNGATSAANWAPPGALVLGADTPATVTL